LAVIDALIAAAPENQQFIRKRGVDLTDWARRAATPIFCPSFARKTTVRYIQWLTDASFDRPSCASLRFVIALPSRVNKSSRRVHLPTSTCQSRYAILRKIQRNMRPTPQRLCVWARYTNTRIVVCLSLFPTLFV
jgi:hypothetical protein